jgi:FkbM family methyltransferase
MGWRGIVYNTLNRPGARPLLKAAVAAIGTVKTGRRCRISFEQGVWIRHYVGGTIVEPRLDLKTLPEIERLVYDYAMYQYLPRPGDIVLDIGAGTGWETLALSKCVGISGRVLSVEAHPRTYLCLEEMCRRNRLENVITMNCAVGSSERDVYITDDEIHVANTVLSERGKIRVLGRTIASIASDLKFSKVDLLKMNIEGAERLAIEGLGGVIEKTRYVCICCHDFLADLGAGNEMRTKSIIIDFLQSNGFKTFVRESDPRPDVRDCVYGSNAALV